jgi:soluble lytic murein transglycosylase-like protein
VIFALYDVTMAWFVKCNAMSGTTTTSDLMAQELLALMQQIAAREVAGATVDKQKHSIINATFAKLVNASLTPDTHPVAVRHVLQVVRAATMIETPLMCAVLVRAAAFLPERRLFREDGLMAELVDTAATILALLQVRDPQAFGSYIRGTTLLA